MPRSSGTYSLPAGNPVVSGSVASSSVINTTLDDLGDEITNSIPRDGTAPPTANTPWGNFKITGLGDATVATDAMNQQTSDARYLLASDTRYLQAIYAVKTATTSRTSTTTLADDPHLLITLPAGTWAVELWAPVWASTLGTNGFQYALAFSGTSTSSSFALNVLMNNVANSRPTAAVGIQDSFGTITVGTGISGVDWIHLFGTIIVTVAGDLSFQWSQSSLSANATNVGIGGRLVAHKLA